MLILLAGCLVLRPEDLLAQTDEDGDGTPASADCDDHDPTAAPGTWETCDGIDNDCDGQIDEDLMPDDDGDGFGDASRADAFCFEGWVARSGDCDDQDPAVFPGQEERCNGRNDGCRDGWSADDEAGRVTWIDGADVEDLSADFAAGTFGEPAQITLPSTGTVHICPPEWYAALSVTDADALSLIGHAGEDGQAPILSGGGAEPPISASSGSSMLISGMDIKGGYAQEGGGLDIRGLTDFTLADSTVRASRAYSHEAESLGGGGLLLDGVEEAHVSGCTFADNIVDNDHSGGAISARDTALTISDSTFTDNLARRDGGAIMLWSGALAIARSHFEGNTATYAGGAINAAADTVLSIEDTTFADHSAGGGGVLDISGAVTLEDVDFAGQYTTNYGTVAQLRVGGSLSAQQITVSGSEAGGHTTCPHALSNNVHIVINLSEKLCDQRFYQIVGPALECSKDRCTGDIAQ